MNRMRTEGLTQRANYKASEDGTPAGCREAVVLQHHPLRRSELFIGERRWDNPAVAGLLEELLRKRQSIPG